MLQSEKTPDTVFLVSTLHLLLCLVISCLSLISESSWLPRHSSVRIRIPRLHPLSPSWHRNLRRRRALARLSLARGRGTSGHVARLLLHHGSCPPMTAKWVCPCGVMHPSRHDWCSCGKFRSHGIQLAGGGGQRSFSRRRQKFSNASDTVEPWTCTVCSQEVTTNACTVCGLRKSYLAAAQPREAGEGYSQPCDQACSQDIRSTACPTWYRLAGALQEAAQGLADDAKNAIVLQDTAFTAPLE